MLCESIFKETIYSQKPLDFEDVILCVVFLVRGISPLYRHVLLSAKDLYAIHEQTVIMIQVIHMK